MATSVSTKSMKTWQRRRIFYLAKELDMSTGSSNKDDDLHILIFGITGENSLKNLSFSEANKIIGELDHRHRFRPSAIKPSTKGGATKGQQQKIVALMCELRKYDRTPSNASIEQRVARIISKELGITATKENPYAWLKYKDVSKLIEIIKGYLATAIRQAKVRGEPDG